MTDQPNPGGASGGEGSGNDPGAGDLTGFVLAGRYRILKRLGEGAMGSVYLGEHIKIGRQDAIKVLRDSMARDPEAIARFMRGARNVSAIRHPNVCTIYDFSDTADGLQFMAMEFVPGETLKDLLQREGRLSVERSVIIGCQVASALQAAHEAGIVHRDLKPGNIMIAQTRDGSDAVKVVDFDIAKGPAEGEGEEVTRLGFVVGTPEYMSPEQLMGERLDGRSDVYSLGLVVFRMLTGALPFRAATTQEVMVQRLTQEPLQLSQVLPDVPFPPGLQATLNRSLARVATNRQPDAATFARELAAAVAGGGGAVQAPSRAAPPPPRTPVPTDAQELPPTRVAAAAPAPTGPTPRRRRWGLIGGSAAGLVVGIVGVILVLKGLGGPAPGPQPADSSQVNGRGAVAMDSLAAPGGQAGQVDNRGTREGPTNAPSGAGGGKAEPGGGGSNAGGGARPADGGNQGGGAPGGGGANRGAEPPPTHTQPAVTVANAAAVLDRQLDGLDRQPSASELQAIRDTAQTVWSLTSAAAGDRATAAYIVAQVATLQRDNATCVTWIQRALSLQPGVSAYQTLLNSCRSNRP